MSLSVLMLSPCLDSLSELKALCLREHRRGGCLPKRRCDQHQILNVNHAIPVDIGRDVFSCLSELRGDER